MADTVRGEEKCVISGLSKHQLAKRWNAAHNVHPITALQVVLSFGPAAANSFSTVNGWV